VKEVVILPPFTAEFGREFPHRNTKPQSKELKKLIAWNTGK
jgi:hypothetical protein